MTGLLNRRAGKAALEAALHDEDDAPLTVGLLDVDFLKTIIRSLSRDVAELKKAQ